MTESDNLIDLDRHISSLLGKPPGWEKNLRTLLTSGFTRRSWEGAVATESADEMIETIASSQILQMSASSERSWLRGNLAVVTSTWTCREPAEGNMQIIRIFVNRSGSWLCDYWQETRYGRPMS